MMCWYALGSVMSIFGLRAKLSAGCLAGLGIWISVDTAVNYTKTDAVVTAVEIDCSIQAYKREVVERGSSSRAYMPCDLAPDVAKEFGYSASDIKKRHKVSYRYVSPVDKQAHTGEYNHESNSDVFRVGEIYGIQAHKKKADTSQWGFAGKPKAMAANLAPPESARPKSGLRGKL
jgi:hypothetical protein